MAAIYIRKAVTEDFDKINAIISQAKKLLKADGSPQWQDGHPDAQTIKDDIAKQVMWVLIVDGQVAGNAALILSPEPTYATIEAGEWLIQQATITPFTGLPFPVNSGASI